jgi:hypothetical protein
MPEKKPKAPVSAGLTSNCCVSCMSASGSVEVLKFLVLDEFLRAISFFSITLSAFYSLRL